MPNTLLRTRIRKERKALTAKQRANFAFMASLHLPKLLPHLPKNAKIGLYLDDFGELPTAPILAFCQKHGFTPFLPITIKNKPLRFTPVVLPLAKTPLKRHKLGMQEPFARYGISADNMDMIICPLVAMDRQGNRLGMGGGFYDRTFANFRGVKVGWCYHFQVVENLTVNKWDKDVDMVMTDRGVIRC
ncbi:5-formyltetrahydrofolate cyclo-ligase family protein [Moraxella lacunata]|uniref:5-formyltetrahydrofolate cyclo-ligase n=1 Tax=Moraxella lacunata TaxID=477 RepID=A0A378T8D3_MORLA|nr:5-formyltetrahydrofolate cyclo-ligase [Moraxella lacunata]STZ56123.1 5-formyltetrahydrofolate cyclo-ligase family protein [Moraxella lacunata]